MKVIFLNSQSQSLRAITLVDAKWEKVLILHNLEQKNTHISGCKIVHLCIIAIVTMHICTVTVALAFIILLVFSLSFSLSLGLLSLSPHSHCRRSSVNATSCIDKEHHIKKFLPKSSKTRN